MRAGAVAHFRNAQDGTDPPWLLNPRKGEILAGVWGDAVEINDGECTTWMRQPRYYMGLHLWPLGCVRPDVKRKSAKLNRPDKLQFAHRRLGR